MTDYRRYQTAIVISIALVILLFGLYTISSKLKSIPSCIYGCDLYHEWGMLRDLQRNPGNFYQSSTDDYMGALTTFPKFSFYMRMPFMFLYDFSNSWRGIIVYSYLMLVASFLIVYYFFSLLFKNKFLPILLALIALPLSIFPLFKYNSTYKILLPLFFIALYKFYEYFYDAPDKNIMKNWIPKKLLILDIIVILAIVFFSNLHISGFFLVYEFLGLFFILFLYRLVKAKNYPKLKILSLHFGIVLVSSFILNLLLVFWSRILKLYLGAGSIYSQTDLQADLSQNYFYHVGEFIKGFFHFEFLGILLVIIFLLGFATLFFFMKRDNYKKEFTYFYVVSGILIIFSWMVTSPLLGKHTGNLHHLGFLTPYIQAAVIGLSLVFIASIAAKYRPKAESVMNGVFIVLVIILSFYNVYALYSAYQDSFSKQGFDEMNPIYSSLQKFEVSKGIVPEKSLVISTNELCFAVNAFTSMRCLAGRWPHMLTWEDFQKNWLDAAIVLYGNDTDAKIGIINSYAKKYDVDLYLYWDYFWLQSEYSFDQNGTLVNIFDPLRFMNNSLAVDLGNYNISYFTQKRPLDPASAEYFLQRDLIILSPSNYYNLTHPWKPDIDRYLQEVWNYTYNGQEVAVLYKISTPEK